MELLVAIIIAVLGASLGSFFNVLIDRIPRKVSIVSPPSHCTGCGKRIKPWQNIPILSYLLLKGKCKSCGAKIHWHHLAVELVTPLLLVALYLLYGLDNVVFYKFAIMVCFLIPIFFIDAFHKIIPLVLSIPMLVIGLIMGLLQSSFIWGSYLFIFVLPTVGIFCVLYLLAIAWEKFFHKEGLGGGDVLLIPAVAAYFGAMHIPWVIILACLSGILYFLIFIRRANQAFAFGNFIAVAATVWALVGDAVYTGLIAKLIF